ncbi:MAG: Bro-N domain-containing protein [Desulfobacteraceae bacterium]|nr:Bro-N domain-containing protein [Desulfobacteraceae bacterium]
MEKKNSVILFNNNKKVRRYWDQEKEEWYFSVIDVIAILTDSAIPRRYWSDLKRKFKKEGSEVYEYIVQLKLLAPDGKRYATDCFSTKNMLRLIQSVPSPKAEPLKLWLAQVGDDRINEMHDPELSIDRALETYLKKGYSREWINQRLKSIEIRKELTDEWDKRGVKKGEEYAILTNEITKAWSDMSVKGYKMLKGLKKENLRDNMTNLELVLNMLAEATTTEISSKKRPVQFKESKNIAKKGGEIAGNARREIEASTGQKVISNKNSKDLKIKGNKRGSIGKVR